MIFSDALDSDADFAADSPSGTITAMPGLLEKTMMVPRLRSDSKIGAIKQLVDRLYRGGLLNDSLSFLQAVLERENLDSTVIGGTIALPHARARSVTGLGMALGVCEEPIYYPSGDDLCAVRAVCVIAVPMDSPRQYLGLLSHLAWAFGDRDFMHRLLAAPSAQGMSELMSARLSVAGERTAANVGGFLPAGAAVAGASPGAGG